MVACIDSHPVIKNPDLKTIDSPYLLVSALKLLQLIMQTPTHQNLMHCVGDLTQTFTSLQAKELPTLKDNDFLNEGQKLQIGDDNKKYFLEKLKRDVEVRCVCVWCWDGYSHILVPYYKINIITLRITSCHKLFLLTILHFCCTPQNW